MGRAILWLIFLGFGCFNLPLTLDAVKAEDATVPIGATGDWRKPMEQAKRQRNWAGMIEICQRAADEGVTDEYLLRSLSWAHRKLDQTAESWEVARRNHQINPCIWSQLEFIEAARDHSLYEEAVKEAIDLDNNRQNWGELDEYCQLVIDSVSTHTYEIRWRIFGPKAGRVTRVIPIPQQDPYIQTHVEVDVEGTKRWSFKTTKEGIKYIEATLSKPDDVWVVARVTIKPHSWRPHLSKVTTEEPSSDFRQYLGKSEYEGNRDAIDPTGPLAKQLAEELKGATPLQTVENVMNYIAENIPWQHVPDNARESSELCLETKQGSCTPRTFAAVAILRAAGVPARAVRGYSFRGKPGPHATPPQAHTVPEFYLPGLGWVDLDFGYKPAWAPRVNFLRMYIRPARDGIIPRLVREDDGFFKHVGSHLEL